MNTLNIQFEDSGEIMKFRIFNRCPKTNKIIGINFRGINFLLFPILGLLALIWVAIRVIPRPTRLSYPCMKVAMPLASGFLTWIGGLIISALVFIKARKHWMESRYLLASVLIVTSFGVLFVSTSQDNTAADITFKTSVHESNNPMGEAKGIFPGRVVWVHDPDATNENCDPNTPGDGWFLPQNNDQEVIDSMVVNGIKLLTGTENAASAWDSIFTYHNRTRGKGSVGYNEDEKIFLKTNVVSAWWGNYSQSDLSKTENNYYGVSETSPQIILAVLKQLINVVGVPQENIYVGDPLRHIYKHVYEYLHPEFPDVHYLDHSGFTNLGREVATPSTTAKIDYSDRGTILKTNVWSGSDKGDEVVNEDFLYSIFEEAEYIMNLAALKGHKRAGMTAFAKNHFGSHTREDAAHLHNGLIRPTEAVDMPGVTRYGYGLYRVQVDIMGHELLGKKNLFYLMDALWPADQEISYPKKYYMAPFNYDFMSSLFFSFDPVAIESVGFDFLRTEFTEDRPDDDGAGTYVQMEGTDDYLHQAADSSNWPEDIKYDPENDGSVIASLGVHEHWNNPEDKQYSRNLGTGEGIELVKYEKVTSVEELADLPVPNSFALHQNYPNPFNPSTNISFEINEAGFVKLDVFNSLGQRVKTLVDANLSAGNHQVEFNAANLNSGVYYYTLQFKNNSVTRKCILVK